MGAGWEVEYFRAVEQPLRVHWTSKGLHIRCSRYTGLSNDSVCDSLAPVILSDDDPSRGIGRLVTSNALHKTKQEYNSSIAEVPPV